MKTIEPWQITVEGPGWLAGVSGHTGFHGVNPYVNVGVGQILKHLNAISTFAGEVRRDRFGVQGGLLYLNAQAGTDTSGLVSKVRSRRWYRAYDKLVKGGRILLALRHPLSS